MELVTEMLGGTGPRARKNDVITSHEAAESTAHLVAESHRLVETILQDSNQPLTPIQIEEAAINQYGWANSRNRIRSSLPELEGTRTQRVGFIRRPGDKRRRQLWALIPDEVDA